ncbi:MAG: hypothetical protein ACHQ2Y_08010 [Candidatus Lutacidiplasmatales archaeon]
MKRSGVLMTVLLGLMVVGLLSAPTHLAASVTSTTSAAASHTNSERIVSVHATPVPRHVVPAAPSPKVGFPRTVLVETFTAVWCHFCPAETQALYNIEQKSNHSVLAIAELHTCAFPAGSGPCDELYVPPDNTTTYRGNFYGVCGYPDVFFDGQHDVCGGNTSWTWAATEQIQPRYESAIANASAVPSNVSITQSARIVGNNVTDTANITSAVNGTFNVVTYLVQYVNKLNQSNGYGPHDLAWVVRETMHNHPVTLTAGQSTLVSSVGPTIPSDYDWNQLNLSVITFVQNNGTKLVENANMAPAPNMLTSLNLNQTTVTANQSTTVTVHATNTTTGLGVGGAAVSLSSSLGGAFNPASGVTASDGTFISQFTAPLVSSPQKTTITAQVSAANYTSSSPVARLLVNPLILSSVATGLTAAPGSLGLTLNWTVPASGSTGVTYHVYRSVVGTGVYSMIGVTATTKFVDGTVTVGQGYWYKVNSHNAGGFSANTTPISAASVTASTSGLPPALGWWLKIGSVNITSDTNGSLSMFLPAGTYDYSFGPGVYGYVATPPSGPITVTDLPLTVSVSFSPLYAKLQGTVTPLSATVSVDGTAISVVDGSFSQLLVAGTYSVNVSASGYTSNVTSVTLTPGNLTPWNVVLKIIPTPPGSSSSNGPGGLTGNALIAVVGVAAVVAVAAILGGMRFLSKKNP